MFRKTIISLGLGFLCVGVFFFVSEHPHDVFSVQEIEITMADSESSPNPHYLELKEQLGQTLNAYMGVPIWKFSLSEVRTLLDSTDWVRDFHVSRVLPAKVSVDLKPESMVALWAKEGGALHPLTQSGKSLSPVKSNQVPDLPVIRSNQFGKTKEDFLSLTELIGSAENSQSLNSLNIKEIYFSSERGFSVELFDPDVIVEFGFPPYQTKVQRVEKVIEYLQSKEMKSRVIDATFSKKVLVRARKGSYAN